MRSTTAVGSQPEACEYPRMRGGPVPTRDDAVPSRYIGTEREPRCFVCGTVLNVHERATGEVCGNPACRRQSTRQWANAELRRRAELEGRLRSAEQWLIERRTIEPDAARTLAVLPSNSLPLTGLSKRRRREFVDHLNRRVSQAAAIHLGNATNDEKPDAYDVPQELTGAESATLANCCALCRGHCCRQGRGHAFIQVGTVLAYWRQHPDQRPREVLQAYLSRIPKRSYRDSCVYHSESGCTLPREMRSKVCNGYLCRGLIDALRGIRAGGSDVLAASVSDYYPEDVRDSKESRTRLATVTRESVQHHDAPTDVAAEV